MDKGRYLVFTCITLSGVYLYLEGRDAADVIEKATFQNIPSAGSTADVADRAVGCPAWVTSDRPAGTVIGRDDSQPMPPHLDQWLGSETPQLPPGEQHTALPFYLRPMTQDHIHGTPRFLLQMEDELPLAA